MSYLNDWQSFQAYEDVTGLTRSMRPIGMMNMLKGLKLQHVGRHHSGIGMITLLTAYLARLSQHV